MTERLSDALVGQLSGDIVRPGYARTPPTAGIVHIGIGAFHRAHQAVYTDDAIAASGEAWGITGVSLRSDTVAAQLNPQDGLYTVTVRGNESVETRLIGAVREVLVAPRDPEAVIARIASPFTQVVSITISEKGYCRSTDGHLDMALAGEQSLYRYLREGLARRRQAGVPGLTLLSCDNLASNGKQLRELFIQYLDARSPDLTEWFVDNCTTPCTMVDRIVPATTGVDLELVASRIGLRDAGAVVTEPFSQWVIEDKFAGRRPHWEAGGAQFTDDVHSYETAKLRMLNGAHSALAYLGLARGHRFVHEAMADPPLRTLVERLIGIEAASSLTPATGQDLNAYAAALLQRFQNAALAHRLAQISMDGSQKIPQRWLETLREHQRRGISCPAILTALAAWIAFVRGDEFWVDDPRAQELAALWSSGDAPSVVDRLFGPQGLFKSNWIANSSDRAALLAGLAHPGEL